MSSSKALILSFPVIPDIDELKYSEIRVIINDIIGGNISNKSTTIPVVPANCFIIDRLPVRADSDSEIYPPMSGI